jgi:hypothetical protein
VSVEFDDVGVVQRVMDFEFAGELLDHVVLENGRLKYFFYCVQSTGCFVDCLINVAELARTQLSAQVEVLNCKCRPRMLWNDFTLLHIEHFDKRDFLLRV